MDVDFIDNITPTEGRRRSSTRSPHTESTEHPTLTTFPTLPEDPLDAGNRPNLNAKLVRPFAFLIFFHEAVRMNLDEIRHLIADWNQTKNPEIRHVLHREFSKLSTNLAIHSYHELTGLYVELEQTISARLRMRRSVTAEQRRLFQSALDQMNALKVQHRKDNERIAKIKKNIGILTQCRPEREGQISKIFQIVAQQLRLWMSFHAQHLKEEERFYQSVLNEITSNKVERVLIAKGILDSNRHLVLKHQFGFMVEYLSLAKLKGKWWQCPVTGSRYIGNEMLIAYVHCLQMASDEQEYQDLLDLIPNYVNAETWKDLDAHDLGSSGMFRYQRTAVHQNVFFESIEFDEYKCCDLSEKCQIL